jgi:hypothetical protein
MILGLRTVIYPAPNQAGQGVVRASAWIQAIL